MPTELDCDLKMVSSEGPSDFLEVSRARWDEHQRKMSVQKEE